MLTKGDEYPIHQTAELIAFSGTDRNFYDRYFFCAYLPDGSGYCAAAFGVYPHLNIADAHFSVIRNGVQHCVHASRILGFERMDTQVGPIRIEVVEALKTIRLVVTEHEGISADLTFTGRSAPVVEPRFTRRNGTRMFMDLTRFTVNCRVSGTVSVDGKAQDYAGAWGTRDRSWGVRQIGAADPQPVVPMALPQFYWLWAPTNFEDHALYAHVNEDERGDPWNRRASLAADGGNSDEALHYHDDRFTIQWEAGKRHATAARLDMKDESGSHHVEWMPIDTFQMKGIGYTHPEWGHGGFKGELVVEREDFRPDALDPLEFSSLHIQHLARARHTLPDGSTRDGIGIVEQFVIGQHGPSGFKTLNDGATGKD